MNTFRSWSRRAWFLHVYLIAYLFCMGPVPVANSYWTDSDGDGQPAWVEDPPGEDGWWAADSDGDGLSNSDEALFGSDPYRMDSDFDGLTDLVEYTYKDWINLSPWYWDSDGNGYSDYDEYYQYIWGQYPTVHYPSLGGVFYSYYDADGDGTHNPEDSDPTNMDRDNDGLLNWQDSYPDDPYNGYDPTNYTPPPDSDGDGIADSDDPFPWGSFWYNGVEYGGSWTDSDVDGVPDVADSTPYGSFWYNGIEYSGPWTDQDYDGVPDVADPWPDVSGSFSYNGMEYPGQWSDRDYDSVPDVADPWPDQAGSYWWDGTEYGGYMPDIDADGIPDFADTNDPPATYSYWYNGMEYFENWSDQDGDGVPDPADPWPYTYGSYWYNGTEYPGSFTDTDMDGIPDEHDPFPYGSYFWNGAEYDGPWLDADNDGVPDAFDAWPDSSWNDQPHYTYEGVEYAGEWADRDSDGVPDPADSWPDDPENGADDDHDGLSNYEERTQFYTYADDVDSDDDFLSDFEELYVFHTDPLNPVTAAADGQMVLDGYLFLGGDEDSDGLPDLLEDFYSWANLSRSDPADAGLDFDNDGYTNLQAYHYGWSPAAHLDAYDGDEDRIVDALEDAWQQLYPGSLNKNLFSDAVEDFDNDGVMNFEEIRLGMNLASGHSRLASVPDLDELVWQDLMLAHSGTTGGDWHGHPTHELPAAWLVTTDDNNNGVPEGLEAFAAGPQEERDLVVMPQRAAVADCDGDGMPDAWEYRYQMKLRDASDAWDNPDGDSISNLDEYLQGRNPLVYDDPTLQIDTSSLPSGTVNQPYSASVAVSGGTPGFNFVVSYGWIDGVSMDSAGNFYGTPYNEGSYQVTVMVTDSVGMTAYRDFTVTVYADGGGGGDDGTGGGGGGQPEPIQLLTTDEELAIDTEALAASGYSVALQAAGGGTSNPGYAYSITGLPNWLRVDDATGRIISAGASSSVEAVENTFPIWITVTRDISATFERTIMVRPPFAFVRDSLPNGLPGTTYDFMFWPEDTSGGVGAITFSLVASEAPPGVSGPALTMTDGRVTGPLNGYGIYTLTVRATDSAGRSATKSFSVRVESPETPPGEDHGGGDDGGGDNGTGGTVVDDTLSLNNGGSGSGVSLIVTGGDGSYNFGADPPEGVLMQVSGNTVTFDGGSYSEGATQEQKTFEVTVCDSSGVTTTTTVTVTVWVKHSEDEEPPPDSYPDPDPPGEGGDEPEEPIPPEAITSSDGAGPRYRKIGLNGSPLPDGGPQTKDESGQTPEETYVDAYSRELRHGVSDVNVNIESSLLPLMVRRDVMDDMWNENSGYVPQGMPDRPFGPGWSSNLAACLKLENDGKTATITDEQGASQMFFREDVLFNGDIIASSWVPSRNEKLDAKSRWNTLTAVGNTFIYKKMYGTTCTFQWTMMQAAPAGTNQLAKTHYYRLTQAQDRLGNRLCYDYPSLQRIIPSKIYDPDRPGHQILITQDPYDPRVTKVVGPGGDVTEYTYISENVGTRSVLNKLATVTRKTGSGTPLGAFGYRYSIEAEQTPPSLATPRHVAVDQIIDERGCAYTFGLALNTLVKYVVGTGESQNQVVKPNMPRVVTTVTLPDGRATVFDGFRHAPMMTMMPADAFSVTTVSGPAGQLSYHFTHPRVYVPPEGQHASLSFTRMDIYPTAASLTPGGLAGVHKETYLFDWDNGMGLASATDLSGNTTTYTYAGGFDDPVTETTAAGTKTYTYEATTRVMSSMTTEAGVTTATEVEPGTGLRKAERVYDAANHLVKETLFTYGDAKFKGFMTRSAAKALADTEGAAHFSDITTDYVPDDRGRVWKEIVDPQGVASTTITEYNGNGNKTKVIDPNGGVTLNTYDARHRLVTTTFPDGTVKSLAYDSHGNIVEETNENGVKTFHEYDVLNRRTKTTVDLNGDGSADDSYTSVDLTGAEPVYDGDIVTSTTYNARGQVLTQSDARGKLLTNVYDILGRVTSTDDGGFVTSFEYGANSGGSLFDTTSFKPTRVTDPRGMVTYNTYDALYRLTSKSSAVGGTTTNAYDTAGNLISVADPLGRITTNTYDALGQLTRTTYPDNTSVHNYYTQTGKVWKTVDEMGGVTLTTYDALGRTVKAATPAVAGGTPITETTYDAAGNPVSVKDPLGRVTQTEFNARNKPVKVISPAVMDAETGALVQPVVQTEYDAMGQVVKVTDPMGAITRKYYDRAGRLWKTTDALNQATISALDPGGNAITVTNALGQTVTNTYDLHNRLTRSVDAAGVQNDFVYDAGGNKTSIKDGLGQETTFVYDELNRLVSQTYANGDTFTYVYDAVHKLRHQDARGAVTTYEYNLRDKQTNTTFYAPGVWFEMPPPYVPPEVEEGQEPPPPPDPVDPPVADHVRSMTYDAGGRLLTVTETNHPEAAVSYTYDAQNRVLSETSNGVTHQYAYDLAGNRVQATYGTGRVVTSLYDAMNRPLTISEGGRTTQYGYDKGGHAVVLAAANGQVTCNTYDILGRVVDRAVFRSTPLVEANLAAEFDWTYDAAGNVITQLETWPGSPDRAAGVRSTAMAYDGANRLLTETINDPAEGLVATVYTYDAANNRTAKTVTGGSEPGHWAYTHNVANQLVAWTKSDVAGAGGTVQKSATLTYDGNGNRASQEVTGTPDVGSDMNPPNAAVGITTYSWDLANRMMGVTLPNGHEYGYRYDYRGRRVSIEEGGTIAAPVQTAVSFSDGLSVAEWEAEGAAAPSTAATASVEYQRGPDMGGGIGGLLYSARDEGGAAPVVRHNVFNARGDVVGQSDSTAALTWTASYEAFGRRTTETGDNADKQRANTKDEDPTGLLNEGFRYRDLETGVFLSRDPAGFVDGPNVYTYVQQNPWTKNDPEGLFWHIAAAALIGAAISVATQVVADVVKGEVSDFSAYAGAAAGGAATGAVLAATGNPTLAGAAGGAAQSATEQFAKTGTVDGGQVMKDAAVGAVGGKLGAVASKALGCATNKVVKAVAGAAADGLSGAGTQVVDNVLNGRPASEGVVDAAIDSAAGGVGIVTAVQQTESCFLAGTSVTLGCGDRQMIETLQVGQRVMTPEGEADSTTAVDAATWRQYDVRLLDAGTGWDVFEISLLRPAGWLKEHSRQVAGRSEVWVDFEELNASGWAQVIAEHPCPAIDSGAGRVVTATITHRNDDVRTLTLDGGETLHVTGNHRMYSASAQDWVPVKHLRVGEELRTSEGRKSVASLGYQRGRHQVYNIEVEEEHCYFVGDERALTHNDCLRSPKTIKFSQDSIDSKFSDGRSVNETAAQLAADPKRAATVEPIRLVKFGDLPEKVQTRLQDQGAQKSDVFTLDNRRLAAARTANSKVNTRWATKDELKSTNLDRRFSTKTAGRGMPRRR